MNHLMSERRGEIWRKEFWPLQVNRINLDAVYRREAFGELSENAFPILTYTAVKG